MSVEPQTRAWRNAGIAITAVVLLILVIYQSTVQYLLGLWNNFEIGEYGHGYLVLAISIYLVMNDRHRLAALTPCPSYRALPAVVAASLLWLVAVMVDVNVVQAVALLLVLLAAVWAVLGGQVLRALLFPLLYLIFAIPVWFPLSPLLQDITADVVFWVIRLLDVPALRQENMILVPAGMLSIEEACSGLRYLLAALALGTLYAHLNYRSLRARLIVVLTAAAAAVVANIVRVFIVVYLGYATEMQHPYVHDHLMLGWYLFGALVVLLLLVDTRIYRKYQRAGATDESAHAVAGPDSPVAGVCSKGATQSLAALALCILLLAAGPIAVYSMASSRTDDTTVALELPAGVIGWDGPAASGDDWMPVYHGAHTIKQAYEKADRRVHVFVGYYAAQKQGEELINDLNSITNKKLWKPHFPQPRLRQAGGYQVLEQVLNSRRGERRLVWYWYTVAGNTTTSKYRAKMLQLLGLVTGDTQAYVAAVATDIDQDEAQARSLLREFVTVAARPLDQVIVGGD